MIVTGSIVRTSYGTGPYRVTSVKRGCTCPQFHDELNNRAKAKLREPHLHLVCVMANPKKGRNPHEEFYLGGFAELPDGRFVECGDHDPYNTGRDRDELFVDGVAAGTQLSILDMPGIV